ncbi:YtzI protein [Ammoniphilus sp. YIM 78166]|nr:YtzI protein [Ammoniphilus sp. YIM 78166]
MSYTAVMILVVLMCVGMIGLAVWYLNAGYSYKHSIDEIPESEEDVTKR